MLQLTEGISTNQSEESKELDRLLAPDVESTAAWEARAFDEAVGDRAGSLVLFGAGGLGRKTLAGLRKEGIEPLAFADNNPELWRKELDGLTVLPPREAAARYADSAAFVVTIWRAGGKHRFGQFRKQLHDRANAVFSALGESQEDPPINSCRNGRH